MKSKSAWKEKSEKEIYTFLKEAFGQDSIEINPKSDGKKADFLVKGVDVYIEVFSIKDITADLRVENILSEAVKTIELDEKSVKKILDRIVSKILHECEQLPDGKPSVLVAKTEGIFVSPYDIMDAFIGRPYLYINPATMNTKEAHEPPPFRTEEELENALHRISAVIAYEEICPHGRLHGIFGNNKNNAKIPLDEKTCSVFLEMMCKECRSSA